MFFFFFNNLKNYLNDQINNLYNVFKKMGKAM